MADIRPILGLGVDEQQINSVLQTLGRQIETGLGKSWGKSGDAAIKSFKVSQDKIIELAKKYNQTEETLAQKKTKVLVAEHVRLQKSKNDIDRKMLESTDQRIKAELAKEKQFINQQIALYSRAERQRPDVQKKGAGVGAGILGTGRNITGGLGLINAAAITSLASTGMTAFNALYTHAKEADDAIDGLDIALAKVGVTDKMTREAMMQDGSVIADEFAKRTTDVNKLQAIVAGYGGQIGATNKRIVELALANEQALGVPAENLAKMFAKASDPENEAQLSRLGLVFKKGASEAERWAAINERFGKSVDTAKKSTQDGVGNMARVMNSLEETFANVAFTLADSLAPAFKSLTPILNSLLPMIGEFLKMAADAINWVVNAADKARNFLGGGQFGKGSVFESQVKVFSGIVAPVAKEIIEAPAPAQFTVKSVSEKLRASALKNPQGIPPIILEALRRNTEEMNAQLDQVAEKIINARMQSLGKKISDAQATGGVLNLSTAGKPTGGSGDTKAQINRRLFESHKKELDRNLNEGLISEYQYWNNLSAAAELYGQTEEYQDAQSKIRLLQRLEYAPPQEQAIPRLITRQSDMLPPSPEKVSTSDFLKSMGYEGYDKGQDWQKGFQSDVSDAQKEFEKWQEIISPIQDAFSGLFDTLNQGLDSWLEKTFNLESAFGGMAAAFISALAKMVEELLAKAVIFLILSALTGGAGAVPAAGATGLGGFLKFAGFASGGIVPNYYATGDIVDTDPTSKSLRIGGFISKYFRKFARGTDTVPAMLTPGEAVLNRAATKLMGAKQINKLNTLAPRYFAMGGSLTDTSASEGFYAGNKAYRSLDTTNASEGFYAGNVIGGKKYGLTNASEGFYAGNLIGRSNVGDAIVSGLDTIAKGLAKQKFGTLYSPFNVVRDINAESNSRAYRVW